MTPKQAAQILKDGNSYAKGFVEAVRMGADALEALAALKEDMLNLLYLDEDCSAYPAADVWEIIDKYTKEVENEGRMDAGRRGGA